MTFTNCPKMGPKLLDDLTITNVCQRFALSYDTQYSLRTDDVTIARLLQKIYHHQMTSKINDMTMLLHRVVSNLP